MFARLALAAVLAASVPMMGAATADAATGKGDRAGKGDRLNKKARGDRKSRRDRTTRNRRSSRSTKTARATSNTTRSVKKTKYQVITTTRHTSTSRNGNKSTKVIVVKKPKGYRNTGYKYKKSNKGYFPTGPFAKYFGYGKKRYNGKGKCVAAAKTRGGFGKRLIGIKGKKWGHRACKRAMKKCRRQLGHHKASGRNPFARCVIITRG
ncbi:MAG: hypothetical protein K0U74_11445 [Alphaproteobacteria bacterium]|nr:hypothetical protein [Alphaproteobacteria bacterium]